MRKIGRKLLSLFLLLNCLWWLVRAITAYASATQAKPSWLSIMEPLLLATLSFTFLFENGTNRLIGFLVGSVQYVQVSAPQLEERIRHRYQSQIEQLGVQGFRQIFFLGEAFYLPRIVLVFPAVILILMLLKREVLVMQPALRISPVYPVFLSGDGATLAYTFGLGTKFYTAFQDGGLLVSKSFANRIGVQPGVVTSGKRGSIADTWNDHRKNLLALQQEGKVVDRQSSFEFFIQMQSRG